MKIENKNILIASGFSAPYGGNFISMLKALANILVSENKCKIIFIFPEQQEKQWLKELKENHIVILTKNNYKQTDKELLEILNYYSIDLVHTHFEVYDIPMMKAVRHSKRNIKVVWHLHDHLSLEKKHLSFSFLRKLKTHFSYWRHYGYYGAKAYFIGVSAEVTHIATHYKLGNIGFPKKFQSNNIEKTFPSATVILNGIDLSRIKAHRENNIFKTNTTRFFSVGGESYSKGIGTILKAAEILHKDNFDFEIIITKGYTTNKLLTEFYGNCTPKWLKVIEQKEDISSLFSNADIYISASHYETMSMCIAEASIYGLPIIQSDIYGTSWNSNTPSTFLFRCGDFIDLAKQMKRLIEMDKNILKEKCKVTSTINKQRLDINRWCYKIINVYKLL